MNYFKYSGYNKAGKKISGQVEALSIDKAKKQVSELNIFVTDIKKVKKNGSSKFSKKGKKVGGIELVVFTRLLATMVNASIPLLDGLEISTEQLEDGRLKNVVKRIIKDIKEGSSLSEALAVHPAVFNRLYVSLVKAGEMSGKLGEILEQLFKFIERMDSLKRKIKTALIYPGIVSVVALTIIILFLLVFVPNFKANFIQFGDKLPGLTKFFMGLSDFLIANFIYIVFTFVAVVVSLLKMIRSDKGGLIIDKYVLKIPIFGSLLYKVMLVRITRTLGLLLDSGVPIIDSINIVAVASGNRIMEGVLKNASRKVAGGMRFGKILTESGMFPKMSLQMITMGEETGRLPEMLQKVSEFYDSDVDVAVERLTSAITPILIVVLGLFVGLIVVALFLPMFSMSDMVG